MLLRRPSWAAVSLGFTRKASTVTSQFGRYFEFGGRSLPSSDYQDEHWNAGPHSSPDADDE